MKYILYNKYILRFLNKNGFYNFIEINYIDNKKGHRVVFSLKHCKNLFCIEKGQIKPNRK